jgi:hypothetical protein
MGVAVCLCDEMTGFACLQAGRSLQAGWPAAVSIFPGRWPKKQQAAEQHHGDQMRLNFQAPREVGV